MSGITEIDTFGFGKTFLKTRCEMFRNRPRARAEPIEQWLIAAYWLVMVLLLANLMMICRGFRNDNAVDLAFLFTTSVSLSFLCLIGYLHGRVAASRAESDASTRRLAAIVESSDDAIVCVTLDGIITSWNAGAQRIFGYRFEEVVGQAISILIPENLRHEESRILERTACREDVRSFETVRITKDRRLIDVSVTISPIKDESGSTIGASKISRDVTTQKNVEKVMRSQATLLQSVLDGMADAVIVADEHEQLILVNRAADRMGTILGDKRTAEWIRQCGIYLPDTVTPFPANEFPLARVARGEEVDGVEMFLRPSKATEGRWSIVSGRPLKDGTGALRGGIILCRDNTDRKRNELELARRSQELARSNKELERFAYVASHDLQEPLRMINSFTQLLARRYAGKLDDAADEFIGFIVDGATRMQLLINDLLAFSRVTSSGENFEPFDFETILESTLFNLKRSIAETAAVVSHDPLPTLRVDASQIGQLLQNLISNAIKFRGKLPPRIHLAAERRDDEWIFSVRDNGIGFDPIYAQRIFIIFQRLHGKEAYPGTGIGLAICMKIAERHGGRIWAESELGRGACFFFTIPAGANLEL